MREHSPMQKKSPRYRHGDDWDATATPSGAWRSGRKATRMPFMLGRQTMSVAVARAAKSPANTHWHCFSSQPAVMRSSRKLCPRGIDTRETAELSTYATKGDTLPCQLDTFALPTSWPRASSLFPANLFPKVPGTLLLDQLDNRGGFGHLWRWMLVAADVTKTRHHKGRLRCSFW